MSHASVVIIGGGAMGVSAAYHLARAGVRDVVLLERGALGEGSTCRAAGGVRAQFSDEVNILLGHRSLDTFERFATTFHQEIDLHQVGYLFLLDTAESVTTFEANIALQNSLGVSTHMISPREALALSPGISTDGLLAAAWAPRAGHCSPESVVLGYATAARRLGAQLVTGCEVTDIEVVDGAVAAVVTDRGRIHTDTVVCAAGAWSGQVGSLAGVDLPVTPLRRQVLITEPVASVSATTPFTIDFSTSYYFHHEGKGLLLGMSDPDETPGFELGRSEAWLPRLGEAMARRTPSFTEVGIRGGWAGLYEVTPDHNALIGEANGVSRFLYATGFSGHGFLMAPAVGEIVRDLYLGTPPVIDVSSLDVARFDAGAARPETTIV
ncbi:NAD(P)/FAD-dependent oxidoreductase [Aeromicrobium wangtongii]|uniref:FAD-binding oxidoreductase n=1 Tax=Aeromicrobium wangtongii TaxID=2969247 RepID=A0ABY5M9P3_9ACTN|nr:FAD-binding oxidoreductase [Aeromicrobium wangtongii]MCD9196651.1 FAD-binding oxidoreductase [Aeromicrobium wangtongii]MCL3817561.1 FAD-binding oxidoreductase [Aeromicrobium wangtongii]UUP14162.1 FAD-binding oxidoreductase [Aeromicrobium wangtongii]